MANLYGAYSSIKKALPKEPPIAKAYILIKKGGRFSQNQESSELDEMLSQVDISSEELNEFKSEVNSMLKTMGVEGPFNGFEDNEKIFVQLNPRSYTISSRTNFKSQNMGGVKNKDKGFGTYPPPDPRTLKVTFYYDTSIQKSLIEKLNDADNEIKGVLNAKSFADAGANALGLYKKFNGGEDLNKLYLDKIMALTQNLQETHTPPLISFNYGSTSFVGYTKEVNVDYKKFNNLGEVIRAEVTMTIEESKDDTEDSKESSGGISVSSNSGLTIGKGSAPSLF